MPYRFWGLLDSCLAAEEEQLSLMPMPTPFDGYVEIVARVSSTCLVTVERNQYSVPCHLANRSATIHLYSDRVDVYTENANIARHKRLLGRDEVSYDWQHYIPLLEKKPGALRNGAPFAEMPLPLAQLQAALRRRERQQGVRIMAKVLAAVLSRLNDLPIPAQVETRLMALSLNPSSV